MTTIYHAWGNGGHKTLRDHANEEPVDLLVAFPFWKAFEKVRKEYNIGKLALDSGAFSAWNSGKKIELVEYNALCKDVECTEIFGLDVIWNPEATQRNLEKQWSEGIDAIPTFHGGSDWRWLDWAKQRPKIAISNRKANRQRWMVEVFKRIFPHRVHGFGIGSRMMLDKVPFHSIDATSWLFRPAATGDWIGYNGKTLAVRAKGMTDFRIEVEEYQRRSRWAAVRWRNALKAIQCT